MHPFMSGVLLQQISINPEMVQVHEASPKFTFFLRIIGTNQIKPTVELEKNLSDFKQ